MLIMNLKKSLDLSSELHCVLTADGYMAQCNAFSCRSLGFSESELMQVRFVDLIILEDVPDFQKLTQKIVPELMRPFKARLRKKSGEIIRLNGKILQAETGEFYLSASISVMSDSPLARFRRFFDMSLLDIVIITDENQQLIYANRGFAKTLGYPWNEIQNKPLLQFVYPNDQTLMQEFLYRLQQNEGENGEISVRCIHRQGGYRWLSWSMIFNRKNLYAIANNITKKKEQEIQIQQLLDTTINQNTELTRSEENLKKTLKQLETRNFELDQFVYKVSHDVRAPLSSILGLINLAKLDDTNTSTIFEYFDMIEASTVRLDTYIKSLLDFSRNERSEKVIEKIDIPKILDDIFDNMQFMTNYDQIEKKITVLGDSDFYNEYLRMRIVLNNLMSNAIKYQDVNKNYHFIKISIDLRDSQQVLITFEDNGIGIAEEVRGSIFDMFYRGTELADGSGLGLYIVKQTIEKLAGEIVIESHPKKGTCVALRIPNRSPENAVDKIH